jgi:hypothetical protein
MIHTGPGLPEAMRRHYTRQHYERHGLQLVHPEPRRKLRGIEIIEKGVKQ